MPKCKARMNEYDANLPVLLTVYYPRSDRYFEGGEKYANKIFQGS